MKKMLITLLLLVTVFTLTSCVNEETFTINFNSNGGTEVSSITITHSDDFTYPTEPVLEGNVFVGWYVDEAYTNEFSVKDLVGNDITLYAKWSVIESALTIQLKSLYNLAVTETEFDGTYEEWLESISGEDGAPGLDGIDGREIVLQVADGYIQWQYLGDTNWMNLISLDELGVSNQEVYTVTFDTDGGNLIDSEQVVKGHKATRPQMPVKEGHNFLGWFYQDQPWVFYGYSISEDIILTAKWEETVYSVSFVNPDGTVMSEQTYSFGDSLDGLEYPSNPQLSGHIFVKWNGLVPETMPSKNIVLEAEFVPVFLYETYGTNTGFGNYGSMAVNNTSFIVGARNSNYVKEYDFGSVENTYLYSDPYTEDARYGQTVFMNDEYVVIGAPDYNNGEGAVFVRPLDVPSASYMFTGSILSSSSQANFGQSVSMINNYLIVGAPNYNNNQGAVFVYDLNDSNYERIIYGNPDTEDAFGYNVIGQPDYEGSYFDPNTMTVKTVNVTGNYFVVTSPLYNGFEGEVNIYKLDDELYERTLDGTSINPGDHFGQDIIVTDFYLSVTAPNKSDGEGAVHIFRFDDSLYERILNSNEYDSFGRSIAVEDSKLVVGAYGAVFVYDYYNSSYSEMVTTTNQGSVRNVAMIGDIVLAIVDTPNQEYFEAITITNNNNNVVITPPLEAGQNFGFTMKTSGDYVLLSASGYEEGKGAVYVFDINDISELMFSSAIIIGVL